MVKHTYRTKQEEISYFKKLSFSFEKEAREAEKAGETLRMRECLAKADAYALAAFDIERNTTWELAEEAGR